MGSPGPGLPEEVKEHLRTLAESKIGRSADLGGFVKLVDMAASQYWATRSLQDQALPATVREEIRAAHEALLRLTERIKELGGTSRHLLYSEGPPGTRERFRDAIMFVSEQLARACRDADELSRCGGPPRNYARTYLAALVAHAIETRLGIKATITSGGLFEDVLKTVVEALEKRPDPAVHDLMRAARRVRVSERPDGVIEIGPQVE